MITNDLTRYVNELTARINTKPLHLTAYFDTENFIKQKSTNAKMALDRATTLNLLLALVANTTICQISLDEKLSALFWPWQDLQVSVQQKLMPAAQKKLPVVPAITSYADFFKVIVQRNYALSRGQVAPANSFAPQLAAQQLAAPIRFFRPAPASNAATQQSTCFGPTIATGVAKPTARVFNSFNHTQAIAAAAIDGAINGLAASANPSICSATTNLARPIEGLYYSAHFAEIERARLIELISNVLKTKFSALELEFITPLQHECLTRQLAQSLSAELIVFKQTTQCEPVVEVNAAMPDGAKINYLKQQVQLGLAEATRCVVKHTIPSVPAANVVNKLGQQAHIARELYHSVHGYKVEARNFH